MNAPEIAMGALACLLCVSCVVMWGTIFVWWFRRVDPIPTERRSEPPWCLADFMIAIIVLMLFQSCGIVLVRQLTDYTLEGSLADLEPDARALYLLMDACTKLLAVGVSIAVVMLRSRQSLAQIGFSSRHIAYDLRLGGMIFLLLAPLSLLIQYVATRYEDSTHPLIELLKQQPDARFAMIGTFSAVFAAPVAEEYLFRGLIQGVLERVHSWKLDLSSLLFGVSLEASLPNPDTSPAPMSDEDVNEATASFRPPLWPIFVSSTLFALLHWNHGPDWIALLIFALGLGCITRSTGRLVPAITAHMLLNAWSIVMLALTLMAD